MPPDPSADAAKSPEPRSDKPGYGPDRGELYFRLVFSLLGLALLAVTLAIRGLPKGPALVEVIGVAGLFFGGSAIWTIRRLWQARRRDPR